MVQKGSILSLKVTSSARLDAMQRAAAITSDGILNENQYFSSPSAAANFVCGRSADGWIEWKTSSGELLQKYRNGDISQHMHYIEDNSSERIEIKQIPDDRVESFKEALTEDFYYISEIKKIYQEMFDTSNSEDINTFSLRTLGFFVYGTYAIKNYETAETYFAHLLTKDDVYDISVYNKKFANLQTYYETSRQMRLNYEILLFNRNQAITMNRLNKLGITKDHIHRFCDEVESFVDENSYFTMYSLRSEGFSSDLDDLGFEDFFYSGILSMDPRFEWQRIFGEIVLTFRNDKEGKTLSKKSFLRYALSKHDSIEIEDFVSDCLNQFGIRIPNVYEIKVAIADSEMYYDKIMDKVYRNKDFYYAEFDD